MMRELRHILCIDDQEDILTVTQMALETVGGYEVSAFESGATALDALTRMTPDLILIDAMMPGMDGPAVLHAVRERPALDDVPVVIMTARVQATEIDEYLAVGAAGVIPKPFDPMTLSQEVERYWVDFHARR